MANPPITELLRAWRQGGAAVEEELVPAIYAELRRRAEQLLRGERRDHTLEPTALVHEAYLRLVDQRAVDWQDRAHFFAIAARVMRRVLLDHARKHNSQKRGGKQAIIPLEAAGELGIPVCAELLALDDALQELAEVDPERARVVELRYFGGLSLDETAAVLGCSPATVVRHWRTARAWLLAQLAPADSRAETAG